MSESRRTKSKKPSGLKLWLHGASGKMGTALQTTILEHLKVFTLVGGSSDVFEGETLHQGEKVTPEKLAHALEHVDMVLDFSSADGNETLLEAFQLQTIANKSILIGTTGIPADQVVRWRSCAEVGNHRILLAQNTSLGVLMLLRSVLDAAPILTRAGFDIEIIETHHNQKQDSPSGTATLIADSLVAKDIGVKLAGQRNGARRPGEIGIHSVRGGGIVGEHQVRFISKNEEVSISHRAFSRELFADGTLRLAAWLATQKHAGLYTVHDVKL